MYVIHKRETIIPDTALQNNMESYELLFCHRFSLIILQWCTIWHTIFLLRQLKINVSKLLL